MREHNQKLAKQAEIAQMQELANRSEFIKSQINQFDRMNNELQNLEIQYTMSGDDRLLVKAKELCRNLKNLKPLIPQLKSEVSRINMQLIRSST